MANIVPDEPGEIITEAAGPEEEEGFEFAAFEVGCFTAEKELATQ